MAWNSYWNNCALLLVVLILGIVPPQDVQARPKIKTPSFISGTDAELNQTTTTAEETSPVILESAPGAQINHTVPISSSTGPVPVPVELESDGLRDSLKEKQIGEQVQAPVKEEEEPAVVVEETTELPIFLSSPRNKTLVSKDKNDLSDFSGGRKSCRKPGVKYPLSINYDDLRADLETGAVLLIDVRNRTELETTCKLPWSVNVPLHEVTEAFALDENTFRQRYGFPKPAPEDTNIVLTCRSGRRIQFAWKKLEPLGYCNIKLYSGSWLDWKARGGTLFPVFRDQKLLPEKCP